jgi:uncharacterized protein YjbJ (UPF0337 family)
MDRTSRVSDALERNCQGNGHGHRKRVVGSAKAAKGAVKQTVREATGDAKLQVDGRAGKVEG